MSFTPQIRTYVTLATILTTMVVAEPARASGPEFIRGECNSDGSRDIADAIFSLSALFGSPPAIPICESACDVNDDGDHNIADPILLLTFLFGTNPPPIPAPSDQCGVDPTPDTLGCNDSTEGCGSISLPFAMVASGGGTAVPAQETIIRDANEWTALWGVHASGFFPPPPLPVVDFTTEMVIVIVEPVTGPITRIEVFDIFETVDPITGDPLVEIHVVRTFCPSPITIIETPFTMVVTTLVPVGDPLVVTFDGGCP